MSALRRTDVCLRILDALGGSPTTPSRPSLIRRTVFFTGHVQGVGFRYTTCQVARAYPITGYVKNLPDGRVEALAEGDATTVERFFAALADEMAGHIRSATGHESPATGEFTEFSVRY